MCALGTAGEYVYLYVGVYVVDPWCQLASGSCSPVHQGQVLLHTHSHMHVLAFLSVRPVDALRTVGEYVYLYVGVYVVDAWCR